SRRSTTSRCTVCARCRVMTRPSTIESRPAPMRIQPMVLMLTMSTASGSRPKVRIAPTTMRRMPSPRPTGRPPSEGPPAAALSRFSSRPRPVCRSPPVEQLRPAVPEHRELLPEPAHLRGVDLDREHLLARPGLGEDPAAGVDDGAVSAHLVAGVGARGVAADHEALVLDGAGA